MVREREKREREELFNIVLYLPCHLEMEWGAGTILFAFLVVALTLPCIILVRLSHHHRKAAEIWRTNNNIHDNTNQPQQIIISGTEESLKRKELAATAGNYRRRPESIRESSSINTRTGDSNADGPDDDDDRRGINNWRCACESGFLPPGIFGNLEGIVAMGSGQCYHKKR